jgi:ketosteroid isomerase-like protein
MTGDQVIHELFAALDALDVDRLGALMADDVQAVDEVRRKWVRGWADVTAYLSHVAEDIEHVTAQISDITVADAGDTQIVTFMLDQSYDTHHGHGKSVHAPATAVLRREGDDWKVALYHSVTLRAG